MAQNQVSCVVIAHQEGCQGLIPVGIITERDIVQFQTLNLNLEKISAQKLMSTPLFLVNSSDSLWTVNQLIQHHRIRRLVVANEQGKLAGIITQSSLMQVLDLCPQWMG